MNATEPLFTWASSTNTQDSSAKCLKRIHVGSITCNSNGSPLFTSDWTSKEPTGTSLMTLRKPRSRAPPLLPVSYQKFHCSREQNSRPQDRYATYMLHNGKWATVEDHIEIAYFCIQHLPLTFCLYRSCYDFRYIRKILRSIFYQDCGETICKENKILAAARYGP